jgi:hypothetical protein
MGIGILPRYLLGNREAILTIAGNRQALWIGFLFVLSAGFAREYDGEDLLHEPWRVVIPVGASLLSSFVLFSLAYGVAAAKKAPGRTGFFTNYASFLALFWMTAPLAWLYAIPYERFLSPPDAMRMNLLSLGIVSVWRVALMVRVMMVILDYSLLAALSLVLLFADGVALILLQFLPFPLIIVIGGVRLTEAEEIQRAVACKVFEIGGCSLPLWGMGCLIFLMRSRPKWQVSVEVPSTRGSLIVLAFGSVLVWSFILPWTQPEQIRKRRVEKAVAQKRFVDALAELSRHTLADYPSGWDPPPRHLDMLSNPDLLEMLKAILANETAPWVRQHFFEKFADLLGSHGVIREDTLYLVGYWFSDLPEGAEVVAELERHGHAELAKALKKVIDQSRKRP